MPVFGARISSASDGLTPGSDSHVEEGPPDPWRSIRAVQLRLGQLPERCSVRAFCSASPTCTASRTVDLYVRPGLVPCRWPEQSSPRSNAIRLCLTRQASSAGSRARIVVSSWSAALRALFQPRSRTVASRDSRSAIVMVVALRRAHVTEQLVAGHSTAEAPMRKVAKSNAPTRWWRLPNRGARCGPVRRRC